MSTSLSPPLPLNLTGEFTVNVNINVLFNLGAYPVTSVTDETDTYMFQDVTTNLSALLCVRTRVNLWVGVRQSYMSKKRGQI